MEVLVVVAGGACFRTGLTELQLQVEGGMRVGKGYAQRTSHVRQLQRATNKHVMASERRRTALPCWPRHYERRI